MELVGKDIMVKERPDRIAPSKPSIMISVNPPYTSLIINGIKPAEFRKKVLNCMMNDHLRIFLYETKNKGGVGAVVGEAICGHVYDLGKRSERAECLDRLIMYRCEIAVPKGVANTIEFGCYLEDIGFGGNHAVWLKDIARYKTPIPVDRFANYETGEVLGHPPQNMFRVHPI